MEDSGPSSSSYTSPDGTSTQRTKQQTSSRMMKTTKRGRPYAKDTHDLFATLIVSLQLTTHRQYFKSYQNSFTTDEAAENLSALKFSQSNRAPDPREPSRVVTTTTTTTFSMNRDMAKGICQHFMDARLIENAADPASGVFKDKGVYQLTPKGLHILERFITKNGINGEHLLKVFSTQPICMKLLHLERRAHDDEILINRPIVEAVFRRFSGRQPNYLPGTQEAAAAAAAAAAASSRDGGLFNREFDRTMGIGVQDYVDKQKGSRAPTLHKHTFSPIAALDWLCDFTTICGRDEAAEVAAHFQRMGFVELLRDVPKKELDDESTITVRGEDGPGRVNEGQFKCHYKAVYGLTDLGRAVARWPGYTHLLEKAQMQAANSNDAQLVMQHNGQATGSTAELHGIHNAAAAAAQGPSNAMAQDESDAEEVESIDSGAQKDGGTDSPALRTSQDLRSGLASSARSIDSSGSSAAAHQYGASQSRAPSAAEKLKNDYMRSTQSSSPTLSASHDTSAYGGHYARDSNTNRLRQILEEPALRSLFRDFLKQNFCEENLSFWLDVQDFKRRFHTTSSAVAVRPGAGANANSGGSGMRGLFSRGGSGADKKKPGYGFTAMEKHQQDLIAMAFVIYNTYLAPSSPCELNIEHSLRQDLVSYMNKVLNEAKATAGNDGGGVKTVRAQDLRNGGRTSDSPQNSASPSTMVGSGPSEDTFAASFAGPDASGSPFGPNASVEERKSTVSAAMPRAPLHASQLQTMVRLYERIQDHTFRLMATDSVPRFIRDGRFLRLIRSVEEYTEALESGRLDPNDVAGPVISKTVVDALELEHLSGVGLGGGTGLNGVVGHQQHQQQQYQQLHQQQMSGGGIGEAA